MATVSDIAFPGLRFNPLAERRGYQVLSINNHLSARAGSRISTRRQQDLVALKLYSSFPAEQISRFSSARRSNIIARASNDPDGPVSKSFFSLNILDVLGFLIRIPALILGFIKKEKQIIDKVEDQIDDAAETVSGIAEAIEQVAGVVERVAESIADDARDTRELMDKVEATADSMRSDIGTAIDSLQGAADPTKPKTKAGGEPDVKAAADATSRAAEKAQKLKDAATELEEKHTEILTGSTTNAMSKSHHFRAISPSRGRSAVTLVLLSAMLSSLIVSNWPAILKHVFDFLLHHSITM
ncbi:uncharacterized protein LOC112347418 isoform X1 [Selaginella moellendorffii]|uniref:uncharacterized protein LOC112347418 isoform X1 n=1 Tax=Selaginella moellendorffii TaxID=88036 RepID=UPI000D1C2352|nr:uncharacterized protein LOC112347418 isoform X1 [Selaginella moellendorffii]|eukprot:XP_024533958.1 uncharacterized protein LOC112347418 isoform X1 [Selaginella moellendorffii]